MTDRLHYEDSASGNFSVKVPEKLEASIFKADQDNPEDGCSKLSWKVSTYVPLYRCHITPLWEPKWQICIWLPFDLLLLGFTVVTSPYGPSRVFKMCQNKSGEWYNTGIMQTYATVYANMLRPNKFCMEFRVEECGPCQSSPIRNTYNISLLLYSFHWPDVLLFAQGQPLFRS